MADSRLSPNATSSFRISGHLLVPGNSTRSARTTTRPIGAAHVPDRSTFKLGSFSPMPVQPDTFCQNEDLGSVATFNRRGCFVSILTRFVLAAGFTESGRNPVATATSDVRLMKVKFEIANPEPLPIALNRTEKNT